MPSNRVEELDEALANADWAGKLSDLDASHVRSYIPSKLSDEQVVDFYVNDDGGTYVGLGFALQVLVRTDTLIFEFLFDAKVQRYDVMYLRDIYKIEERGEEEDSVEGPPRQKVTLTVVMRLGDVASITQYGTKAQRLSSFGDSLRKNVFQRSS